MAKMGDFDISEFKRLQNNLNKLSNPVQIDKFMKKCVKEIAMETLRRTIKLTPVSMSAKLNEDGTWLYYGKKKDKKGKIVKNVELNKEQKKLQTIHTGGTLRRGWIAKSQTEVEANSSNPNNNDIEQSVYRLRVEKLGQTYVVWLINVVEYASYVEYGHRQTPGRYVPTLGKRLKLSWVEGRHMLQISMQEVESRLPQFLDRYLQDYLNQIYGGN